MRHRTLPLALAVLAVCASTSYRALAQEPTPPPAQPAPSAEPTHVGGVDVATLAILHEKNILNDKEYESALKDLNDTSGLHAADSNTVVVGKWATTLYGFAEFDSAYDSTQSFTDAPGNAQVARDGTYAGQHDRLTFGIRNSRIGLRMKAPEFGGIRVSGQAEMDFLGTQLPVGYGQPYFGSEAAFFTNPTFRVRHMNMKAETGVVDVLIGQYWQLFGWQSVYHPNTVEIQGVPGQVYSRTPQVRISKTIKTDTFTFEAAVAAMRPPQRDSATPEGQAGLRFAFNKWNGVVTNGATSTSIQPVSIAVTGDLRRVALPNLATAPTYENDKTGTAIAVDAFVPVIPGSKEKMGNSLSLTGEVASGYGTSDLYTGLSGGASIALPNPNNLNPAPAYPQDVDNGIAAFATDGSLHLINWTSYILGLQYYLPGTGGHLWLAANYSHHESGNMGDFFPASAKVRKSEDWADGNVFADVTPAMRLGVEYAWFQDKYVDGNSGTNHRVQFSAWFIY
jgi:hypothetical protein